MDLAVVDTDIVSFRLHAWAQEHRWQGERIKLRPS